MEGGHYFEGDFRNIVYSISPIPPLLVIKKYT
jgi:hypothetical protein